MAVTGGGLSNPFTGKAGVGDFFAPFYRVRFLGADTPIRDVYGPDGELLKSAETATEGVELRQSGVEKDTQFSESGVIGQLRSFATSLEVNDLGGGACTATLHLEPTYIDALYIVDHKLIQYGAVMVIEFGWLGSGGALGTGEQITSDPHYYIIQQPSLNVNNLDISIDIVGVDIFGFGSTQRTTSRVWDRNDAAFKTDLGVLEGLLPTGMSINTSLTNKPPAGGTSGLNVAGAGSGVLLNAADVPTANTTGIHVERPIEGEPDKLEQNDKDWVFFGMVCASNNCTFFTVGSTIFIADRNVVNTRQSSYRLLMYQQLKSDRDIPILSWSTNALDQLFQPAEAKETCANSVNLDTNVLECNIVDPGTSDAFEFLGLKTVSGKGSSQGVSISVTKTDSVTPDGKYADNQTGKVFSVPYRLPNKKEVTTQPARDAVILGNTDATATTPGVPTIVPLMIVEVQGVGDAFKGPYFVMEAKHRLDTSGYETELKLVRDTSSADIEVGVGVQPPSTNNPDTDTTGGESVFGSFGQTT